MAAIDNLWRWKHAASVTKKRQARLPPQIKNCICIAYNLMCIGNATLQLSNFYNKSFSDWQISVTMME